MKTVALEAHLDCLKDVLKAIYKELKIIKTPHQPMFFSTLLLSENPPKLILHLDQDLNCCIDECERTLKLGYESHYQSYIKAIENVNLLALKKWSIGQQVRLFCLLNRAAEIQQLESGFDKFRKTTGEMVSEFTDEIHSHDSLGEGSILKK